MSQVWEVVGGAAAGGLLVRAEKSIKSAEVPGRLSTGAFVLELQVKDERLEFKRLAGTGPERGWVTWKTKGGELLVKSSKTEAELTPASTAPATVPAAAPAGAFVPVGLMFPGQGSQYLKMLEEVKDLPAVKQMLLKANEILGWDVLDMCLNGPEEKIEETCNCQPIMFLGGMCGMEKLRAERPEAAERPQLVAGLSLGEYTALCVAGVFTFEDALKLVKLRGEAMQEAANASKQAMLSVAGVERGELDRLCAEAVKKEGAQGVCQVANCLFPKGYACAGTEKAVLHLKEVVEPVALQAKLLKTSGGFHTPLMKTAAEKLGVALEELRPRMSPPKCTVFANATGQALAPGTDPGVIVDLLKRQLTEPVLWEDCVRGMIATGVVDYYEVGPMKQLKAMMKRIDMKTWKTTVNIHI